MWDYFAKDWGPHARCFDLSPESEPNGPARKPGTKDKQNPNDAKQKRTSLSKLFKITSKKAETQTYSPLKDKTGESDRDHAQPNDTHTQPSLRPTTHLSFPDPNKFVEQTWTIQFLRKEIEREAARTEEANRATTELQSRYAKLDKEGEGLMGEMNVLHNSYDRLLSIFEQAKQENEKKEEMLQSLFADQKILTETLKSLAKSKGLTLKDAKAIVDRRRIDIGSSDEDVQEYPKKDFRAKIKGALEKSREIAKRRIEEKRWQSAIKRENATVYIQAITRGEAARKQYRRILKRTKIVGEILSSEQSYLSKLRRLNEAYLEPLEAPSAAPWLEGMGINSDLVDRLFASLKLILMVNGLLLLELETRLSQFHVDQLVGDIFVHIAPLFEVYTDFINSYSFSMAMLTHLRKTHPEFNQFLNGSNIDSLLITPIQRIPRYQLLIQEVIRYTSLDHPDYDNLCEALDGILAIAHIVNESKRERESLEKLISIQNNLVGEYENLVQTHRLFLREGVIHIDSGSERGRRMVWLFNDIIIYGKQSMSGTQFQFLGCIELSKVLVEEDEDGDHSFNVKFQGSVVNMTFSSEAEKQQWMNAIRDAAQALRDTYRSRGQSLHLVRERIPKLQAEIEMKKSERRVVQAEIMYHIERVLQLASALRENIHEKADLNRKASREVRSHSRMVAKSRITGDVRMNLELGSIQAKKKDLSSKIEGKEREVNALKENLTRLIMKWTTISTGIRGAHKQYVQDCLMESVLYPQKQSHL